MGLERAQLVLARRVVAVVVEPGLADRHAPAGAPRARSIGSMSRAGSKPAASLGWRPTIAYDVVVALVARRARAPIDSSFMPTVAIRVRPASRARATSSSSGGLQLSR